MKKKIGFKNKYVLPLMSLLAITPAANALSRDVNKAALEIQTMVTSSQLTAQTCSNYLKAISDSLYVLPSDQFTNDTTVTSNAQNTDVINQLYKARISVNQFFRTQVMNSKFSNREEMFKCANQITIVNRNIREMEDLIGLNSLTKSGLLKEGQKQLPFVDNQWPMMLTSPEMKGQKIDKSVLKSGDTLLSRGVMPLSAPISRIAKIDNQFTHLSIVYIDDGSLMGPKNKGKVYIIESEPDFGVQIVDFERYIRDTKSRVMLLRYREANKTAEQSAVIAAAAAKFVAEKANPRVDDILANDQTDIDRRSVVGNNMPVRMQYNYAMDDNIDTSLFCSQVVAYGFKNACQNNPGFKCQTFEKYALPNAANSIPLVSSQYDIENNSLVKVLGLKNPNIFSPADIEIDPRFVMLAEWRNYNIINTSRLFDMALSKMFQYTEKFGYSFADTEAIRLLAKVGNQVGQKIGRLPDYAPEGYARGTMLATFLTTYSAPGDVIKNLILSKYKTLSNEELKNMLVQNNVVDEATAKEISEKAREIIPRMLNHVSFTKRIKAADDERVKKAGRHLSLYQMDGAMDFYQNIDCNRFLGKYKAGENFFGPVMYHDIFRKQNEVDKNKQCLQTPASLQTQGIW